MTARISLNPGTAGAHRTPTGVWTFARVFGAKTPLLGKGGVAAPIKKKREASLAGADGEAVKKLESSAIPLASLQGGVAERFRKYREAAAYREAGVVFR